MKYKCYYNKTTEQKTGSSYILLDENNREIRCTQLIEERSRGSVANGDFVGVGILFLRKEIVYPEAYGQHQTEIRRQLLACKSNAGPTTEF
jgi:hypothetical protein